MSEAAPLSNDAPADYGSAPKQVEMVLTPALECLQSVSHMEVKEKASIIEALTALVGMEVEMPNRYRIFEGEGEEREIFYAVEQTTCLKRQAKQCCPDCAPWELKIFLTAGGKTDLTGDDLAFTLKREATCTCCCFNRPKLEVVDAAEQPLGTITDPFACCDLTFKLEQAGGEGKTASAKGGCCQWGLCCPLPCGPCSRVDFALENDAGESIGSMTKQVPSCLKYCFAGDVDNYKMDFDNIVDPRWKALLMAFAIFVDFRYFSDNPNDEGSSCTFSIGD